MCAFGCIGYLQQSQSLFKLGELFKDPAMGKSLLEYWLLSIAVGLNWHFKLCPCLFSPDLKKKLTVSKCPPCYQECFRRLSLTLKAIAPKLISNGMIFHRKSGTNSARNITIKVNFCYYLLAYWVSNVKMSSTT